MNELLTSFGRGLVKVLISGLVGTGVGLVTFGASTRGMDDLWSRYGPPSEMFLSIGAGLLSSGALLVPLFFNPFAKKKQTHLAEEKPASPEKWLG